MALGAFQWSILVSNTKKEREYRIAINWKLNKETGKREKKLLIIKKNKNFENNCPATNKIEKIKFPYTHRRSIYA